MPLRVNEKKIVVDELRRIANEASSAVAADYHGCSVVELTKFRKNARNSSVHLKVIRNTLARKALMDTKFSCFEDLLIANSQRPVGAPFQPEKERVELPQLRLPASWSGACRLTLCWLCLYNKGIRL